MQKETKKQIEQALAELRMEHRDLDHKIEQLQNDSAVDQLELKRLKRKKLRLKDMIAKLESDLIPDMPA